MLFAIQSHPDASWLISIGIGLILCLAIFIVAIVFLASRMKDVSDVAALDSLTVRLKTLEAERDEMRSALRRHGILKSRRDTPSPPPYHISEDSA